MKHQTLPEFERGEIRKKEEEKKTNLKLKKSPST
jgi:hypothetical protein